MPAPTKESLIERRDKIRIGRDQLLAQANGQNGAIAILDELIEQYDKQETADVLQPPPVPRGKRVAAEASVSSDAAKGATVASSATPSK